MELQFLRTDAGVSTRCRDMISMALKFLDKRSEVWLFNCDEGTQMRILRTIVRSGEIGEIFIIHLCGDHVFGLPGLANSRSFQGGNTPLETYRPEGIEEYIRVSLGIS